MNSLHLLTSVGVRALARLTALLTLALALPASAELIGVDHFDYADGAIAGKNGGTFWDYKNVSPIGHTNVKSNWDYIGFSGPADISGGKLVTNTHGWAKREYNGQNESEGAISETNVAKAVYARVTVTTGATLPSYFGIASYDLGAERFFLGKRTNGTFGHEIIGGASGNTGTAAPVNSTFTLVFRLDFAADRIQLFLNPNLKLPITDPANVAAGTLVADAAYTATHPSTALRLASGDSGDPITWDNFVVATTWEDLTTVVTTLVDEDDGPTSLSNLADISLREAVKYSTTGLITFAPGLSGGTITLIHTDGEMEIPGALTIDASALPGGLTVSGNNATRHFYLDTGKSLTLRGLTLTAGNGVGGPETVGGSIVSVGTLNLHRCTLTGNASTSEGGAIYSVGSLRATDCTLSENTAGNFGGAIMQFSGTAELSRCTLSENTAGNFGGAIMLFSGTAELSRCTLSGNTASDGGGFFQQGATPVTLSHCTVAGNRSTGGGSAGGISGVGGTLNLQHCTISQNTGNGTGGGLFLQTGVTVNLHSCIIAGNADPGSNRADIFYNGGTLNPTGTNLIGSNESVTAQFPTGPLVGTAAAPVNPKLSPLGYFGGPVQTRHPLIGSPAIDAAGTANPGGTDARGFPRFEDGDTASPGKQLDIGAVEAGVVLLVNQATDSGGSGTLRTRLANAAILGEPSFRIVFDPAVFPASTITLNGNQLTPPAGISIFIDASNLSAPVTVSGNNASRVFNIPATATVAMHSVRIVNGQAPHGTVNSGNPGGNGGGILHAGSLSLMSCTIANNRSGNGGYGDQGWNGGGGGGGGAIFSSGPLSLTACTISSNTAGNGGDGDLADGGGGGSGGAIFSSGPLSLTACTISSNTAGNGGDGDISDGGSGGGILKADQTPYRLIACTLAGNRSGDGIGGPGQGAGISGGRPTLQHCLMTDNLLPDGTSEDLKATFFTFDGINLLTAVPVGPGTGPPPLTHANALLAPLGDYGGPTQTMALRPGSPARNAATGSTRTTDQRGFPMVGVPDIGAYEAGTLSGVNLATTLAETLPGTGPASGVTPAADFDGDGQSNAAEITAGTLPADATSLLRITALSPSGENLLLFFTSVAGKTYTLWRNDTLTGTWVNTGFSSTEGPPGLRFFTVPVAFDVIPKRFYRVQVGP